MCGLHGQQAVRMICKARSCAQQVSMLDTDHVSIAHVLGSFQTGRILHDVITSTTIGNMAADVCTVHENVMVRIEYCELSFFDRLGMSNVRLGCTGDRVYKHLRGVRSARRGYVVIAKGPAPYAVHHADYGL